MQAQRADHGDRQECWWYEHGDQQRIDRSNGCESGGAEDGANAYEYADVDDGRRDHACKKSAPRDRQGARHLVGATLIEWQ
jgi:hypothetical protein